MPISTGAAIEFFGTQDTVSASGGTAAVVNGAMSADADGVEWTNVDDAPMASVVLTCTYGTTPTTYSNVVLLARLMNIDGTNDMNIPDANFLHTYLGAFPINDVTSTQYLPLDVRLPNTYTSQVYKFYIQNNGGQTMTAGWTLKVTPKAIGSHA